ncbi:hypothetical protein PENARI_c018G09912 [Penicillium arizonense]|uniref:Ketoreductase (KR) domain-containing protein n=1 Tax=Penicillium arizonense TaxID=1835702 RepID=A0A1F5LAF3_PENAI|nr:hypothetical protein PENARI_c018G09912 [Penicillium arizonense]OGE50213.1 hypothetical protein PENARI_c018G09912 [Penicillium arizonense]
MPEDIPLTPEGTSLAGKTALVTGGNKGLGFEVARQFLLLNVSRLIITARDEAKGRAAVAALKSDPEVIAASYQDETEPKIEFFLLNLDDYQSGVLFTRKVNAEIRELHILVLNAGINIFEYQTSKTGHEKIMQVNCYTHFLIVLTLMSLLRKTSKKYYTPSRITFVGSYSQDQHSFEEIPIPASQSIMDYYDDKTIFRRFRRYQDSKFVVNAFVQQLARITSSTEVIINNVCPGVVQTNLNQTAPLWFKPFMWAYTKVYRRTLHEGGRIIVKAAVVVGNESHGLFVQNSLMDQGAPFLAGEAGRHFGQELWNEVVDDVERVFAQPRV